MPSESTIAEIVASVPSPDAEGPGAEPRAGTARHELWLRVLSSCVLVPAALLALVGGLGWTALAVFVTVGAGWREWLRMTRAPLQGFLLAYGLSCLAVPLIALVVIGSGPIALGLLAGFGTGLLFSASATGDRRVLEAAGGLFYLGFAGLAMVGLRAEPEGLALLGFLLVSVWASDIAGFFVGRWLGGPRLSPIISPGKTWTGAVGSTLAAAAAGYGVALAAEAADPVIASLVAALLSIVGQAGDLAESAAKRHFRVKDSGRSIPGHGGVLDRVDALLAAALALGLIRASGAGGAWW